MRVNNNNNNNSISTPSWLDGANPFSKSGHISHENRRKIKNWIIRNETLPTEDDLRKLSGWQFWGTRDDRWLIEVDEYIKELAMSDPQVQKIKEEYNTAGKSDVLGSEDFVWDPAKVTQEGTKEHDLYDFYRQFGDAQHEVGKTELVRSERDMQVEMAQQRSQLVDEVRKRRQNQLRSGLSSAQIANEEIQMLLMGQQAQQQTAQQHFDGRTQMNQQHQLNPFMAQQQAREEIMGTNQGMAGSYAAWTGDAVGTGLSYGSQTPKARQQIDHWLKPKENE